MKTEFNPQILEFQPVTLTLTIESEEELKVLRALYDFEQSVADAIEYAHHMDGVTRSTIVQVLRASFQPLQKHPLFKD
jgi:hypothetical protein